ncbi:MAG: NADH-quinone oxidoreductase subunit NuoE [Synergistales bacterium]|nr:NADH-quinone oxidoreductase subunit NuoE [Synergistales bacterium]
MKAPAPAPEQLSEHLDAIIERYRDKKGATIPLLAEVQDCFGYLPENAVSYVARNLDIPAAQLFGVATFYSMFRFQPEGKYVVRLCRGTACHVQGSLLIGEQLQRYLGVKEGATTDDGMFTLQYVACLGCCSLAPVMMVGDQVHGRLTPDKAVEVLEDYRKRG